MRVNGEAIRGTTAARIPADGGGSMVFQETNPDGSEKALDAAGAAKTHEVGLPRGGARRPNRAASTFICLIARQMAW
jgi:hypothetical protein